jgi:hypothetical protein
MSDDKVRTVARRLVAVGRAMWAFNYKDGRIGNYLGPQYLSRTVDRTMKEAEAAFSAEDYDRADHLAAVVECLVAREAPKFAADPQKWIERWEERRWWHT